MKIIRGACLLLFNSLFLIAMDAPKQQLTTPLSADALVKVVVEGKESEPLELQWQQVKLSGLGKMVEDLEYNTSLPFPLPAGVPLNTAQMIFTMLKPYAESSLTNEEDRLKENLDPQLKKLSLSQLVEIANGANLLSVNKPILERIGARCTKLITTAPHLKISDYDAIDSINTDFFKVELPIKPEPIMADIKELFLKKQLNYGKRTEFDIGFDPVMGHFYEDSSIAFAGMVDRKTFQLSIYNDKGKMSSQEYSTEEAALCAALTKDVMAIQLYDNQVIIKQRSGEKKACRLKFIDTRLRRLIFSPSGKYLISFDLNDKVYLCDIDSIDWSKDSNLKATKIGVIDMKSKLDHIDAIFFTSDTDILIAGTQKMDSKLLRCITSIGEPLRLVMREAVVIHTALHEAREIVFSDDGKYLLDCYWNPYGLNPSYVMVVYDIENNKAGKEFTIEGFEKHYIISMCFNRDNSLIACGGDIKDGIIKIYDVATGALVHSFSGLALNKMMQFSSKDRKMMSVNGKKFAVWDVFTKDYFSAIKNIEGYDYDRNKRKLTFLYRFLSFLKNKKKMDLEEGDLQQFNLLHDNVKSLLNYIKEPSQETKPSYSYQSAWQERWQQFQSKYLNTPGRKAMIFYGALVTSASAIGYALYKYLTSTSATAKD